MNKVQLKVEVAQKVKKRKLMKALNKLFWLSIAFVVIVQLWRLNGFLAKVSTSNLDQSSMQVEELRKELEEVRRYLLMPSDSVTETTEEANLENSLESLLRSYEAEKVQKNQVMMLQARFQRMADAMEGLVVGSTDFEVVTEWTEKEAIVSLRKKERARANESGSKSELLAFGFEKNRLFLRKYFQTQYFDSKDFAELEQKIAQLLVGDTLSKLLTSSQKLLQKLEELQEFVGMGGSEEILALLTSKKLILKSKDRFRVEGLTEDQRLAFSVQYSLKKQKFELLDAKNSLSGESDELRELIKKSLVTFLNLNQFDSLVNQNVSEKLAYVNSLINKKEFLAKLSKLNLNVDFVETESEYQLLFVEQTELQPVVFSLVLEKETADFYLLQKSVKIRLSFNQYSQLQNADSTNYLIVGKQGNLTDSLIIANLNDLHREIKLLSVPRDLYIDKSKINALYSQGGMQKLTQTVSEISGLKIEKYVLIDMFAFIDIVDYLGGVTVFLEEEVVDPSYKTFDNGVWSTMAFTAGEHTLNGRQALRLARSRYTSSDFARAERQQLLIASLLKDVNNLSFKDFKTLSQIVLTVARKTETNIAWNQLVRKFLTYKDYSITTKEVLSTNNILVSTFSNLNGKCAECGKGAYILLPRNNDWSLVRSYVKQALRL